MSSVRIRPFTKEDATAASHLIRASFDDFVGATLDEEGVRHFAEIASAEKLRSLHQQDEALLLIGEVDGHMAGVLGMKSHRHLLLLFVAGAYHGRGVAGTLWREAKSSCLQRDPGTAPFTVNSSDYAVEIYKRFGFTPTGPRTVKNGLSFTPMQLNLKSAGAPS